MKALITALFLIVLTAVSSLAHAAACQASVDALEFCNGLRSEKAATWQVVTSCTLVGDAGGQQRYHFEYSNVGWDQPNVYDSTPFSCPVVPPPPTCTAGTFVGGGWVSGGAATGCSGGCETVPSLHTDDGITKLGTSMTGGTCSATSPPPDDSNNKPPTHPGYTPDDPNDPSKGGKYCDETATICVHGPAPNTGGSGGSNPPSGSTSSTPPSGSTSGTPPGNGGTGSNPAGGSSSGGTGGTGGTGGNGSGAPASGSSSGGKDGKCTAGDACDNGSAAGVPSNLYHASGDTVSLEYSKFKDRVSTSPLIGTTKSMFTINVSGQCPVWSMPATAFTPVLVFDFLCKSPLSGVLVAAGFIVLATAVFYAIKIAIY